MEAQETAPNGLRIQQAELILKLFEMRRETVMREARSYIGGDFMPASTNELVEIVTRGNRQSSFVLQVYGYWDMVAAFVFHGALDADLVFDTCHEMYFQYAKIRPFLTAFRERMNMPYFAKSIERLTESSEQGRSRLDAMQKNLAVTSEIRAQAKVTSLL